MHPNTTSSQPRLAWLALAAITGQVALLASAWLLPVISEYDLISDNISELVLGRFGWIQTFAFVLGGLGTLALAYAVRQLTQDTWSSRLGAVLVGLYGVGAVLVAAFPTDRIDRPEDVWTQSTTGMIHISISLVSFAGMIVAMFILFRTFLLDSRWRPLTPWIVLLPCASLSLMLGQGEGPHGGLLQRLLVSTIGAWILTVATRVRTLVQAPSTASAADAHTHATGGESTGRTRPA
jgi:hypothetical protein